MTRVAAIQMTSSADVTRNLADTWRLLRAAQVQGAVVATLPENFAFMGRAETDKLAIAEADGEGPIQRFLASAAREFGLWIVAGTLPLRAATPERVAAACLVFDADGRVRARYDKIHLFDVSIPGRDERYLESKSVQPGTTPICVDTPAGRLGLAVCYDMRFPELFRELGRAGADWVCLPSAFTAPTGRAHWEVLLRARAIENLVHVVAPAQSGFHENGRETYGDSLIIDCWGRVLSRLPRGTGCISADLDLVRQHEVRHNFPALEHRRFDAFPPRA